MSSVWKEVALIGTGVVAVGFVIGWWNGAENLKKKKKPAGKGRGGAGGPPNDAAFASAIELYMQYADSSAKKNQYEQAEKEYHQKAILLL